MLRNPSKVTKLSRLRKNLSRALRLESLESRNLMAANLIASLNLSEKVLRIEGTPQSDQIAIVNNAGNISVQGISIQLSDGRVVGSVSRSMLTTASVLALDGDDTVSIIEMQIGNKAFPVTIDGGNGSDTISGSSKNDKLYGGAGDDIIDGLVGDDLLDGGINSDSLRGGIGVDRIYGRDGDDKIWGEAGNDYLDGSTGNDTFFAVEGTDRIFGGAGADKLTAAVTFGTLTKTSFSYYNESTNSDLLSTLSSIESAEIQAVQSGFAYTSIDASQFDGTVKLTGSPVVDYLTGGTKADELFGADGDDMLVGNGGNDVIDPGLGNDYVDGGEGIDTIENASIFRATMSNSLLVYERNSFVDPTFVVSLSSIEKAKLVGQYMPTRLSVDTRQFTGDVTFFGTSQAADIMTGIGNDVIYAGDSDDQVFSGSGNDTIYGGMGSDMLFGEDGSDTIYGDNSNPWSGNNDQIFGGEGMDLLYGGFGNDWIYGEAGIDSLHGEAGNDKLYGNGDLDLLYGGLGNDFLDSGSAGESTIWGEEDNDYNAWQPIVDGTIFGDVQQVKSPTCWIAAALASAAKTGLNLASRIEYQSNGIYKVGLYERVQTSLGEFVVLKSIFVKFEGDLIRNSAGEVLDLMPHRTSEGDSWATIFQRAYLQSRGLDLSTVGGGNSGDVLFALTGKNTSWYGYQVDPATMNSYLSLTMSDAWTMFNAVNAGKNVTATTEPVASTHSSLVNNHVYTVVSMTYVGMINNEPMFVVVVYNPWSRDGASASGDPNDGLVAVTWNQFRSSFGGFEVN